MLCLNRLTPSGCTFLGSAAGEDDVVNWEGGEASHGEEEAEEDGDDEDNAEDEDNETSFSAKRRRRQP